MAVTYAVAIGHDQPAGNLQPLDPQPASVGSVPGRRIYLAAGGIYEDLHNIELIWAVLDGGADYRALLVQLGLSAADTCEVTLGARDDNFLAWTVNAVVYRPEHGREVGWQIFPSRLTVLARDLEAI